MTVLAQAPPIAWHRSRLLLGLALAIPSAVVIPIDPRLGLALAVGVLPAATTPLPPRRRGRVALPVLSVLFALCLGFGALLGGHALPAVLGVFVLCIGASVAAERSRLGLLALRLALPLVGIGLSFDDRATVLATGALLLAGGLWAYLVALAWPEQQLPAHPTRPAAEPEGTGASRRLAIDYGIRLGLAAAIATGLGFAFHVDHKGWMCGAVLFVMRPNTDALLARSLGRAGSVVLGGLLAATCAELQPGLGWLAALIVVAVAALSATQGSRWYITPFFSTFLVLTLMLYGDPGEGAMRFWQRSLETLIGVALALLFGALIPYARNRRRTTGTPVHT